MITQRQQSLLKAVVDNYIHTAEPVGSQTLASSGNFDLSAATLRNELRALEEAGYLTHPHTSAGRIPTEAGYALYVESLMEEESLSDQTRHGIDAVLLSEHDTVRKAKAAARYIANDLGLAVIVIFEKESLYYTGISQLFAQPEFRDYAKALNISSLFDQVEDHVDAIYEAAKGTHVCFGSKNPLGSFCGSVIKPFHDNVFLTLGPIRMNYARARAVTQYTLEKLASM